jgi:hypothetical protein
MFASDGGSIMRTYKDAKAMAKSLRDSMAARSYLLSHSACLEIVAKQFSFADWNASRYARRSMLTRLATPQACKIWPYLS